MGKPNRVLSYFEGAIFLVKTTTALAVAILALVVAACGGASDEVGGSDAPKAASGAG